MVAQNCAVSTVATPYTYVENSICIYSEFCLRCVRQGVVTDEQQVVSLIFQQRQVTVDQQPLNLIFCSLAVLDPKVDHTIDVLSPFISVL